MPEGAFYGQEATMPEGAFYGQEATMPEATQARQRSRPQVHLGNKKVHLWGQEATQARQVHLWGQEGAASRAREGGTKLERSC